MAPRYVLLEGANKAERYIDHANGARLTLVGRNGQLEVEHVGRVGELGLHRLGQLELGQVCDQQMHRSLYPRPRKISVR